MNMQRVLESEEKMGRYAATIHCVKKVKNHLDLMLDHIEQPSFRLKTDNTKKLATQLREAFSYLKKMDHVEYNNNYLKYLPVAENFILKERNEFLVVERRMVHAELILDGPIIQSMQVTEHVAYDADDLFSVVGYVVEHKNIQEITFPRFEVEPDSPSMSKLQNWCDKNNYNYKLNVKNQLVIFKL